jgi:hypothetical protein
MVLSSATDGLPGRDNYLVAVGTALLVRAASNGGRYRDPERVAAFCSVVVSIVPFGDGDCPYAGVIVGNPADRASSVSRWS